MFFEGPEKKVELAVKPQVDLRALGETWWAQIVERAQAQILSKISNAYIDAYLLSESSLFVSARKALLITCGRTTLVDAVEAMLDRIPADALDYLVYERKNEHFPEYQPTGFLNDASRLYARLPCGAWRLGAQDGHRVLVLASTQAYQPTSGDRTLEVLMHGVQSEAAAQPRAHAPQLFDWLEGFTVDEHSFEPAGFSLNAIREDRYATLHVTPEDVASYVSFETNLDFGSDPTDWVQRLVSVFEPASFDVLTFSERALQPVQLPAHQLRAWTEGRLPCGYQVALRHFFTPPKSAEPPFELPISRAEDT